MSLNHGNLLPHEVFVVVYDGIVVAGRYLTSKVVNAEYSRDENGMIIRITMGQISNYFDAVEGDEGEKAWRTCSM